jgi:hypothetical protein
MDRDELMQILHGILNPRDWLSIDHIYERLGSDRLLGVGDTRLQQAPRIRAALDQMQKEGVVVIREEPGRTDWGNNLAHRVYRLR